MLELVRVAFEQLACTVHTHRHTGNLIFPAFLQAISLLEHISYQSNR